MRRIWLPALALAGCQFEHGVAPHDGSTDAPAIDAPAPDAPAADALDAYFVPYCDPDDTTLVACYTFEGSTQDGSGHGLDATMTNVTFVPGKVGMAMQVDTTSATDVADSPLFDLSSITIEAWIHPSEIPTAGLRAGIVDCEGQYGLFLHEQGRLQCTMINGPSMQIDAGIAPNVWTHVACTYDGTTIAIYVDGAQEYTAGGGTALATNGTTGISLGANNPPATGSRFVGLLDQIRILDVARPAADILADAQQP